MGTTNSSEVVEPDRPCAIISLRSWKGVSMETLIAVPAYEEVFAHHHGHPLFSLLHSARNEPAVRHWYAAVDTNTTRCDEKKTQTTSAASATAGTATLSEELISRLVVPKDEYSEKDETTSSQGGGRGEQEVGKVDRTTELEPQVNPEDYYKELFLSGDVPTVRRWMMLTLKGPLLLHPSGGSGGINYDSSALNAPGLNGEENGFLTVEQVTQLVQQPGAEAAAAGYLECNHGALATSLRYWMVKTFSTEGRSLVLFQAAAFMEARRMQQARVVSYSRPSVMEFAVRDGDISSLRMLELTFRRLLPTTCGAEMSSAVISHDKERRLIVVRLSGEVLVDILRQLEVAVLSCPTGGSSIPDPNQYALQTHLTGPRMLTLAVEHRQVAHIATPFAQVVESAKASWNRENAVVVQVQPNQRQAKQKLQPTTVSSTAATTVRDQKKKSTLNPADVHVVVKAAGPMTMPRVLVVPSAEPTGLCVPPFTVSPPPPPPPLPPPVSSHSSMWAMNVQQQGGTGQQVGGGYNSSGPLMMMMPPTSSFTLPGTTPPATTTTTTQALGSQPPTKSSRQLPPLNQHQFVVTSSSTKSESSMTSVATVPAPRVAQAGEPVGNGAASAGATMSNQLGFATATPPPQYFSSRSPPPPPPLPPQVFHDSLPAGHQHQPHQYAQQQQTSLQQPHQQPTTAFSRSSSSRYYNLPENTQVQFLHAESGNWVPMLYVNKGARLQLSHSHEHQSGSVYLESTDTLYLTDGGGTILAVQPAAPPQQHAASASIWGCSPMPQTSSLPPLESIKLVVASGSFAIQVTAGSEQAVVQLVAP